MNKLTTSLVLAVALGSLVNISADEIITDLVAIEEATTEERPALIKEFKFELKNMGEEEQIQAMHKIREKMPELAQDIQDENMKRKIDEIKNAEPAERVKLMNKFKLELAKMNEKERAGTIAQMQKRIQEKAENEQMNQMQNIDKMEKMNQAQGADQFQQGMINSGFQPSPQGFGQ